MRQRVGMGVVAALLAIACGKGPTEVELTERDLWCLGSDHVMDVHYPGEPAPFDGERYWVEYQGNWIVPGCESSWDKVHGRN